MTGSGFNVKPGELRTYGDKLAGGTDKVDEVKGLVGQADVGDQSWGIVGLFVKGKYDELLGDLKDVLGALREGYQGGADKFKTSAEAYERFEDDVNSVLSKIGGTLEGASAGPKLK